MKLSGHLDIGQAPRRPVGPVWPPSIHLYMGG